MVVALASKHRASVEFSTAAAVKGGMQQSGHSHVNANKNDSQLATLVQVARHLGVSRTTAWRMFRAGLLPGVQVRARTKVRMITVLVAPYLAALQARLSESRQSRRSKRPLTVDFSTPDVGRPTSERLPTVEISTGECGSAASVGPPGSGVVQGCDAGSCRTLRYKKIEGKEMQDVDIPVFLDHEVADDDGQA